MDARHPRPRLATTIVIGCIVGLFSMSLASCNTTRSPNPDEVRKHTNDGFDRLSAEERAKKNQSGY